MIINTHPILIAISKTILIKNMMKKLIKMCTFFVQSCNGK